MVNLRDQYLKEIIESYSNIHVVKPDMKASEVDDDMVKIKPRFELIESYFKLDEFIEPISRKWKPRPEAVRYDYKDSFYSQVSAGFRDDIKANLLRLSDHLDFAYLTEIVFLINYLQDATAKYIFAVDDKNNKFTVENLSFAVGNLGSYTVWDKIEDEIPATSSTGSCARIWSTRMWSDVFWQPFTDQDSPKTNARTCLVTTDPATDQKN